MVLVIIIVIGSFLWWFTKIWLEQLKYRQYLLPYSGPKPLPLLGNSLLFKSLADFIPVTKRLAEEFGKSFVFYFGPKPRLIIGEHQTAEFLLGSQTIIDKSYEYNYFHDWLGTGLLTSTGQKWKSRRKLLTPAFHFQILEKYVDVFNKQSNILVEKLKERVDAGPFDIFPYVALCTLDIICETAMGVQINAQTDSTSSYVWSVQEMCRIFLERSFSPLKMVNIIYKLTPMYRVQKKVISVLHGFTNSVIRSRKANFTRTTLNGGNDEGLLKRVAFLDLLLQYNLSDEAIREEVDTFMFEGHDTTASGISFALYCLSKHPSVQLQVVEELQTIFSGDNGREPTYQDLQEMKYLEMVIKESMRLYPPVPGFSRILNENTSFNGAVLPKGLTLTIHAVLLHRNSDIFPDPEQFDPDRFLPENSRSRPPYAYVPFSAGLRNCIGQRFAMLELKATISKILRNFEILPVPDHEPQLSIEAILRSYNGLPIVLKARSF
ncbi:cytochrome P450 4c3-like [Photinus pyralis]|uniref:Cytochrome P450 n=1 Tax=Photinus pyralis TaxID=7054 RepID=A0A1Y1NM17_PHOPY|nr:cytochrome P450 4c3-like [Photinus pyralis]